MKVLVTGDRGYIGSVLAPMLFDRKFSVRGLDIDYFHDCDIYEVDRDYKQITKDIRNISLDDFDGIDAVIHLAALSNDPLGELAPGLTEEINFKATVDLAVLAKKARVSRFVYASSQSMYGIADSDEELDEDKSRKTPLTAYAKTKWLAECELKKLNSDDFTVVCFRPSTVFGLSPRFRSDIIFNNLISCAFTTGKIEIKSDGTPWRPVIHIKDVCNAFISGLTAPREIVSGQSFNVGIENGNYTVRQIAEEVQSLVDGCELVFTGEHGNDSRTYKVSFNKILKTLKGYYTPSWNLASGGKEILSCFQQIHFQEESFRGRRCNRLKQINYLLENHKIDTALKRTL